jgi:hypothetical protein
LFTAPHERLINEWATVTCFGNPTLWKGRPWHFWRRGVLKDFDYRPDLEYGRSRPKKIAEINPAATIIKELWPRIGEPDYTPYIATILSAKPDMVCSFLWGGDLAFIRQAEVPSIFSKGPFTVCLITTF